MLGATPVLYLEIIRTLAEAGAVPGPGYQSRRISLHLTDELQEEAVLQHPPVVGEGEDGRVEHHHLDVEAVHLRQSVISPALVQPGILESSLREGFNK